VRHFCGAVFESQEERLPWADLFVMISVGECRDLRIAGAASGKRFSIIFIVDYITVCCRRETGHDLAVILVGPATESLPVMYYLLRGFGGRGCRNYYS
jgi:hypothetical protein